MRELGAPQDYLDDFIAAHTPEQFGVLAVNGPTVELFLAVSTQWRSGSGGTVGLDYTAVKVAAEVHGMTLTPEVFGGLQIMERTIVAELTKRAKQ